MTARKFSCWLALVGLACAFLSCRSPDGIRGSDSSTLNQQAAPIDDGIDCEAVDAVSTDPPNGEAIFALTSRCIFNREVHEVRLRILGETFEKVLNDGCAKIDSGYGHALELVLNGHRVGNVGIKVRGNTSRCNPKRQFKFKFDAKTMFSVWQGTTKVKSFPENDKRTFFGLEELSVRAGANDPSMIRERLSSRLFTAAEALAPTALRGGLVYRVAFAKLFVSYNRPKEQGPKGNFTRLIDGHYYDYKGFYSLAEEIDKVFLRTRYQANDSKLKDFYLFQADLGAARFSRQQYKRSGWSQEYVAGKKPAGDDDYDKGEAKLFELFDLLAGNAAEAQLASMIDVDNVVNYVAAAILAGHWDSLLANGNNDFLFFNALTQKWQLITWDLDNTQGALISQYHQHMRPDIFNPARLRKAEIFTQLFSSQRPQFRAKLHQRLGQLVGHEGFHSPQRFGVMIDELEATVKAHLEDWEGYQPQSFEDIKNFAAARRKDVKEQLEVLTP